MDRCARAAILAQFFIPVPAVSSEVLVDRKDYRRAIAEFDARRLYLAAGCSSLFVYCTQVLHLSEAAAYLRIEAARASRRFPAILTRLADGRLSLTTATLLATAACSSEPRASEIVS